LSSVVTSPVSVALMVPTWFRAQVDAIFGLGAFTRLGDGDGVRATDAQAARVVAALASVMARLTVPDSACVMVTSAPTTGWPLLVTMPPMPAEVLWANTGAAAKAATRPSVNLDIRRQREWVISIASIQMATGLENNA
jgi:hypothetical protein